MKRIISALIICAAYLTACSEETAINPGVSFLTAKPEILEETAIFRVIGQPFSSADSVRIPVTFSGSAQMGVDYEVSSDHFVVTKESLTDSIVVYTKQLGTGKNVSLSIEIPNGFSAGKYLTSGFNLQNKYGLLTFPSSKGFIADTTAYTVTLCDSTGAARVLSKSTPFRFAVNAEKSTAAEGVDFEFIGGSELSIAKGSAKTEFKIAPIGNGPQDGRNTIVLNLFPDERFDLGTAAEMELQILKSELKVLDGTWKIDTLVTDSLHFAQIWGEECSGYELVPEFKSSDRFTIRFGDATFEPAFNSGLKQYFTGTSGIGFDREMEITDPLGKAKNVLLMSLDNTNRYFSADTTSTDSVSFIGLYLSKEAETDADILELYILDHTSMSFMPELKSDMKYGTEKPVATAPGMYLNAIFRKTR